MVLASLQFTLDIDGDGSISRWEAWQAFLWLYRLPGNLVLEGLDRLLPAAQLAGKAGATGTLGVILSLVFWVGLFILACHAASRQRRPRAHAATQRQLPWHGGQRQLQAPGRKHSSPPM